MEDGEDLEIGRNVQFRVEAQSTVDTVSAATLPQPMVDMIVRSMAPLMWKQKLVMRLHAQVGYYNK